MSKKNKKQTLQPKVGGKNYQLKSKAVETLANADREEIPAYSKEELERYRGKSRRKLPPLFWILFIKTWFPGAVCFFILWGLGIYIGSGLDMIFVLGIVLGMVTNLLTDNVIRFLEKTPGDNDKWLLLPKKGLLTFFGHLIYGLVIVICVYMVYNLVNLALVSIIGSGEVILGVEPILFGLLCMGFDMGLVAMRNTFRKILQDAKEEARRNLRR